MVKQQGGEVIMSSSFFKVYLPCRSSHHLRLPPAFVKRFNGDFPKDATLKDTSGNLWYMEIEKDQNGVSLKHGWKNFATDHSLEYGDFLVFSYNGNSLFDIKVYGKNGCIKNQSLANNCISKELKIFFTPVKFDDKTDEAQSHLNLICSCKRKSTEESSRKYGNIKGSCHATQLKSPRMTLDPSEFATTTNPYFIASVNPKKRYYLHIPKRVITENGLKLETEMLFRTQEGKQWPVKVDFTKDDRHLFSKGWFEFWRENRLTPQDKCRFEFVLRKNKTLSKKILVTFLRTRTKK